MYIICVVFSRGKELRRNLCLGKLAASLLGLVWEFYAYHGIHILGTIRKRGAAGAACRLRLPVFSEPKYITPKQESLATAWGYGFIPRYHASGRGNPGRQGELLTFVLTPLG